MSDKVKKGRLKAAAIALAVLVVASAIIAVMEGVAASMAGSLTYMGAGERWSSNGEKYAIICAYTEQGSGMSADQVGQWEYNMNRALIDASIDTSEDARAWTWCASFDTILNLTGTKGKTNAEVMVCEGDFFVFHNMQFVSGSGFMNDKSNPMGVVIDEDLAWILFGATDVAGMTFMIHNEEYTVTGVAKPESEGGVYGHTYGDAPRMYMSATGYSRISDGITFTVYETVIPNPVKGFARGLFDGVATFNEDTSDVIEVSERFSLTSRFENMKKLGYSWISVNRIEYPYWENEARVYDYRCAQMMIREIVVAAIGVIALLSAIVLVVISGYSPVTTAKNLFSRAAQKAKKRKVEHIDTTQEI